jgi:hypothetical protein
MRAGGLLVPIRKHTLGGSIQQLENGGVRGQYFICRRRREGFGSGGGRIVFALTRYMGLIAELIITEQDRYMKDTMDSR